MKTLKHIALIIALSLTPTFALAINGAGGSWDDDTSGGGSYEGGGGSFGGGGAGGSWSNSSSTSNSSSCSPDGWEFEYIVPYDDEPSFSSVDQACRYTWSSDFLNKRGYKETRLSSGSMRGKYYRKITHPDDWHSYCLINVGSRTKNYKNNIGGSVISWSVTKYYKGKVEICDPESFPEIPNFPLPPDPNHPSNGDGSNSSSGGNNNGSGGGGINYNYNTYNYDWDITTNNTTNNTNHITNNNGISQEQINALITAIQNNQSNVDLTQVHNLLTAINNNISNLSFERVLDIEDEINRVTQAIKDNKYDDTQLQNKIDELVEVISSKDIDLTPVTDRQDTTNEKLDTINQTITDKTDEANEKLDTINQTITDKADETIGWLDTITGLLKDIKDLLKISNQNTDPSNNPPPDEELNQNNPFDSLRNYDINTQRINMPDQCPVDKQFLIMGRQFTLKVSPLCNFLSMLSNVFLSMAFFAGARNILGALD